MLMWDVGLFYTTFWLEGVLPPRMTQILSSLFETPFYGRSSCKPDCCDNVWYHYQVQHSARPETSHWLLLLRPGLPPPQPEAARPDGPGSVEQHALTARQESHQLELRAAPALSQRGPTVPENKTEQSAEQHEQLHHGLRQLHEHCHAVQYRLLYVAPTTWD